MCYKPRPIPETDLWLMRRIDELHLNYPFASSRMLRRDLLRQQGLEVGRRNVKTLKLMRRMGIEAIYRKPFVERFWKSIKYEHAYLHAYESVQEARTRIGRSIDFYTTTRPHSSLTALTPDQVYFNRSPEALAA